MISIYVVYDTRERVIKGIKILAEIKWMKSWDEYQTKKADKQNKEHKRTKIIHSN